MSLRVTFLGTGGAVPTTERAPSAIFVNREGDRLLFDCGEGTQREMMRAGTGFGIDHLFVSHLHGDHVLGIPGLVQTLGFNDRTDPLRVHCPPGTGDDLHDLVHAVGHQPGFPVRIEEVGPGDVALSADGYEVRAFETTHRTVSQGYVLEEADRPGRFDRPRAEELGVPVGPAFGRLHSGESVELEDGTVVESDQVVGPPRPGRKLVYTADTRPRERTVEVAEDADLLVHDATFADDMADRAR
ncbi:ribonuclease Z, partial [Halorubrum sp. F4]|uniref:ribonuclease Z n=1 Tax=Halorubrum sp. F4 TaxID=2989715 RepID=UPI0024807604